MSGIQCRCGRFLASARPVVLGIRYPGGFEPESISGVRGTCSRCGPDAQAGPGWWQDFDTWFNDAETDWTSWVEASEPVSPIPPAPAPPASSP